MARFAYQIDSDLRTSSVIYHPPTQVADPRFETIQGVCCVDGRLSTWLATAGASVADGLLNALIDGEEELDPGLYGVQIFFDDVPLLYQAM